MTTSKKMMLSVRKKMLAKDLKGIINLPNYDDNQTVEITVFPVKEEKKLSPEEIDNVWRRIDEIMKPALKNPNFNQNKPLDEYRMERLEEKYGSLD